MNDKFHFIFVNCDHPIILLLFIYWRALPDILHFHSIHESFLVFIHCYYKRAKKDNFPPLYLNSLHLPYCNRFFYLSSCMNHHLNLKKHH